MRVTVKVEDYWEMITMVILRLPSGSDWYKANWAYRQLLADFAAVCPHETDLISILEESKMYAMLDLQRMDESIASRIIQGLRRTVEMIKAKESWEIPEVDETTAMYREAIAELEVLLNE